MKIAILVGSLRKESYTRRIAKVIADMLPFETVFPDIDLPLYNQDYDDTGNVPAGYTALRNTLKVCNAYLFVTPEYNRSMPAVIKNAIDIGSRPMGQSSWAGGKKGAVVSISPGKIGGALSNHILRQALVFVDVILLGQPEMYIGEVANSFDENGGVVPHTKEFLQKFADKFAAFVNT